jgi:hypothetical protein
MNNYSKNLAQAMIEHMNIGGEDIHNVKPEHKSEIKVEISKSIQTSPTTQPEIPVSVKHEPDQS